MRVDHDTLKKLAIDLRISIKDFTTRNQSGRLKSFFKYYSKKEQEYLLSLFDRYGNNVEYEKSGIRFNSGDFACFKFGYKTEEDAKSDKNFPYYKARLIRLNTMKKVKPSDSLVTYPTTQTIVDLMAVLYVMKIFNKSFEEASMYWKVKKLKPIMDKISENGINEDASSELNKIFTGLNTESRNKILVLFDTLNQDINFKGIRYGLNNRYFGIDRNNKQCKFKFNSLHLRSTIDILNVWKTL